MAVQRPPIFALATPKGRSAIAVFRISGYKSHKIIKEISSLKKNKPNETKLNTISKNKKKIDQTLTTFFYAPKTYTGEDMVEISCHGGLATINKMFDLLIGCGIEQAKPGEFTRRSLNNDKLDVVQAESVMDLVSAETEKQRILALQNLDGHISIFLNDLVSDLKKLLADTEALIDFSDEDLPDNIINKVLEQNRNIIKLIKSSIKKSEISRPIRDGFLISIIGKPNTGKSSFINYISDKDVSIVTKYPGTTTDTLESVLDIGGYKFRFVDTAGIRKHRNKIEEIGIKKTYKSAMVSDLNIVFLDKSEKKNYNNITKKIFVRSKYDKRTRKTKDLLIHDISSVSGYGIKNILKIIKNKLVKTGPDLYTVFSRERHIEKIKNCLFILESINRNKNTDMIAEDYRRAIKEVSEIYQNFDIEEILDIIFADFCIGK